MPLTRAELATAAGPLVRHGGAGFATLVNLAARASAHAGPGEVLVTGAVVRD